MKKKIWKIISWVLLILTILSVVLLVIPPSGRTPESSTEAAQSFDQKWAELAGAHARGEASEVRLSESELNSKIQQAVEGAPSGGVASMKGVEARLDGNDLVFVLKISILGVNTYVTMGGKPVLRDHILEFDLDQVDMGRMPVPASMIGAFLRSRLESPEMRESMTLPDFIRDVRVENGELVFDAD